MPNQYPSASQFQRLPAAEKRRVLAELRAETAAAKKSIDDRVAALRAAGASEPEIIRDLRGDPTVEAKYRLDGKS